jgi:hypothetical protein
MKHILYSVLLLSTISLYGNKEIAHSFQRMFINDNPKLIVDWTPKCGCTSVWVMLMKNYGLLDEALKYFHFIHRYRQDIYYKNHRVTAKKFFDDGYYKIKFVRNPYERAVSSYLHCCKTTSFKESFEKFLIMLKKKSWHKLTSREIQIITSHSRKQSKLTDKFMHEIIHIENADLSKANHITGLNLSLTKHSSGHHNLYDSCTQYCGDKPYVYLKANHYPDYHCYYSSKTLQRVEQIYSEDIIRYNYQIPEKIGQFLAQTK